MTSTKTLLRPALLALSSILAITLVTGSPAHARRSAPTNRGLETARQPVVQRTDYVFDATPDGYNGLSSTERRRILDWFDAIDLGYGDRVSLSDAGGDAGSGVSNAMSDLVAHYGLLLADRAPATVGEAPSGSVRIVVSRASASVPGCPGWSNHAELDLQGGLSYEYGCGVNGNLAAMIANPDDLVQGRESRSALRGATASRAIKAYRDAVPTGGGNTVK
ncbi:MAG TPA: CpaD family pilus assembly lipoprotein [Sphingobium sp.]